MSQSLNLYSDVMRPVRAPAFRLDEETLRLLDRYPHLDNAEVGELVARVRSLSSLDLSRLLFDDAWGPKLEAFCVEERPWDIDRGLNILLIITMFAITVIWLLLPQ